MLQQLQEAACDTADVEKKETCLGLNLVVQFLFQELKDTQKVRRYVLLSLLTNLPTKLYILRYVIAFYIFLNGAKLSQDLLDQFSQFFTKW